MERSIGRRLYFAKMNNDDLKKIRQNKIIVVIPTYKASDKILLTLNGIPDFIDNIFVIDDNCPENSGQLVERHSKDERVSVIYNSINLGVGGATKKGMIKAVNSGCDVIVKMDADNQMNPDLMHLLVLPILNKQYDYTKGNRYFFPDHFAKIPKTRLFGNLALSFFSKLSSGFWNVFDPNNGYVAISSKLIPYLNIEKINDRYFFESDMLFRLGLLSARILDVPMLPIYGDEKSTLNPLKMILPFTINHIKNFFKRIAYKYFIRDFSLGSIYLIAAISLISFATVFGLFQFANSIIENDPRSPGTVALFVTSIILGFQFLIAFLTYDITSCQNNVPIQEKLFENNIPTASSDY